MPFKQDFLIVSRGRKDQIRTLTRRQQDSSARIGVRIHGATVPMPVAFAVNHRDVRYLPGMGCEPRIAADSPHRVPAAQRQAHETRVRGVDNPESVRTTVAQCRIWLHLSIDQKHVTHTAIDLHFGIFQGVGRKRFRHPAVSVEQNVVEHKDVFPAGNGEIKGLVLLAVPDHKRAIESLFHLHVGADVGVVPVGGSAVQFEFVAKIAPRRDRVLGEIRERLGVTTYTDECPNGAFRDVR